MLQPLSIKVGQCLLYGFRAVKFFEARIERIPAPVIATANRKNAPLCAWTVASRSKNMENKSATQRANSPAIAIFKILNFICTCKTGLAGEKTEGVKPKERLRMHNAWRYSRTWLI